MEVATALRVGPTVPLRSVQAVVGSAIETGLDAACTLTHPPLPASALGAWWAQESQPPAPHAAWTAVAVGRAAVSDPLAPKLLDGLSVDPAA